MNRRQTDLGAGLLVVGILLVGGVLSWDAYRQQRSVDRMGSMMGGSMDAVHGTDPLVYLLGTLATAAVVGAFYLAVRSDVSPATDTTAARTDSASNNSATTDSTLDAETTPPDTAARATGGDDSGPAPRQRVLDLLPEDERRVLEPVLDSPGLTQIELRDRSDFSKSKVSQTVSALEKRGLLYRERQGRTYRVYPSDGLEADVNGQ